MKYLLSWFGLGLGSLVGTQGWFGVESSFGHHFVMRKAIAGWA